MVVVGIGVVDYDEFVKFVEKVFVSFSTEGASINAFVVKNSGYFIGSEVCICDDDMIMVNFVVVFKGVFWMFFDVVLFMVM